MTILLEELVKFVTSVSSYFLFYEVIYCDIIAENCSLEDLNTNFEGECKDDQALAYCGLGRRRIVAHFW